MNRIYRLVFNRALGVLQVASELVRPVRGSGGKQEGSLTATLRPVSFALWLAMGWVGVVAPGFTQQAPMQAGAAGRIVTDPNAPGTQRPTVVSAPNGVPLVNIATPSAAGVSRNTYSQFDVGTQGAILNNSRTSAQTQLGGWVQANPWLATGTARIILNEVNSANPSYLNGYIEVAGDRAQVVIANPAGIQINGGGFLNASRATLTTGTPVFNGGALDYYRVQGGTIGVNGAGLDTSRVDYTDLIARSLQVNAGLWAQNLSVTTGANEVRAADGAVLQTITAGAAPAYGIDVGQLGGMYAGKIILLGTEHGVGVRNAGEIGAQAGSLVVTVDGRLENTGALQAQQDTRIDASGGVANAGTISAGHELTLDTADELDNSGGALNAMRIEVNAQTLRNRGGAIEQTGVQALALNAGALSNRDGGRIGEAGSDSSGGGTGTPGGGNGGSGGTGGSGGGTGGGIVITPPPVVPLADGALNIAGLLDNDAGSIVAGGGIALATDQGLDNNGGHLGLRDLTVGSGNIGNRSGTLTVTGSADLNVGVFDNDAGSFHVNRELSLQAQSLSNRGGSFNHGGTADTRIEVAGTLDNTDGTLASNANALNLGAGHLINERGSIAQAGTQGMQIATGRLDGDYGSIVTAGAVNLTATDIAHRQAHLSASQATVNAANLDNSGGQIIATGSGANTLSVAGTLDNSAGMLASNGDLSITASTFTNVQGKMQQAGSGALDIHAHTLNGQGGTLVSNGSLTLSGQTTDLRNGATTARRIGIETGDLTTAGGQLSATGTDVFSLHVANTLDNTGGTLGSNGAIDLSANRFVNAQGVLQAAGVAGSSIHVADVLDNRAGALLTAGDAELHAGMLDNQGGKIYAAGTSRLTIGVDGHLDNRAQGLIAGGGDTQLIAATLDNRTGTVGAAGALQLTTTGAIDNTAGTLQAGQGLTVDSAGLANAGGTAIGAQVSMELHGQTLDNTTGTLASTAGNMTLGTGALINVDGLVQSAGDLSVDAHGQAITNTSGSIASAGVLQLAGGALSNQGGSVFAQGDAHLQTGAIDNTAAGSLVSASDLTVQGTALSNTGGSVQAGQQALLSLSGALNNQAGLVAAGQALTVSAASVDNRDTSTGSGATPLGMQADQLQVIAANLDNRQGLLVADSESRIELSGHLDNRAGLVSSSGQLQVTADAITNTAGTLLSSGDQTVTARVLSGDGKVLSQGDAALTLQEDFTNTGEVTANGALALTTAGSVRNEALLQAGNLYLQAANIDNAANGQITAVGLAHLTAQDTLTNRGLIDGAVTHLQASVVDNLGTGRVYGDHVAIEADELRNHAETLGGITTTATLAAREQLDLGVGTLTNADGALIYSDGNAAIGGALDTDLMATGTANLVNNTSSTIEVSGDLDLQSQAVNNVRENVAVTQTTTVKTPVRLDQPGWRNNGANATSNIQTTSNYSASEVYYLHPDDILEDTPYITPDGYTVHRAVVRLTPQTSAYFFGRGGLYAALGERSRMNVSAGTVTIYYFGRQDNQVNPDQVATGADDPFEEISGIEPGSPAFSYVSDTLNYSSAYGTCTTNCVQLWAQYDYDDPDHILINPNRGPTLGDNEEYRIATQTVTEDVLAPGAGKEAVIHAGGDMRIGTDALLNQYGRIAAGGNLTIDGLTGAASVTNVGQTLYRTYEFDNVTHTYNGATHAWSNPAISEQIGQVGGVITSGGTLTVDVGDLSNLDDGRDAPNVQDGAALGNLSPHDPGAGPSGPGGVSVNGPGASGGSTVDASVDGAPGTVAAASLNLQLPTGSLFTVNPNGGQYLVETDPRFADYRHWLGSDYLLDAMGSDPANVHKRLGDGYYEQKLIREQIGQLTGRRFLEGYANDEDQFRALMAAGALFAKQYGLRPGVSLSAEQMAQLTSDIVWLVEQTVTLADGSTTTVLVPQVFLRLRPGDLHENGALLAGENVNLKLSGNLVNTGDIAGRQVVAINAANIHNLAGGAISGQAVGLQAAHDINVIGGTVTAGEVLNVKAGGNVTVASTTQVNGSINRIAGLYVTSPQGLLVASAGRDLNIVGAQVINQGSGATILSAGHDLNLTSQAGAVTTTGTGKNTSTTQGFNAAQVSAGGSLMLSAGNDVTLTAAQIAAGRDAAIVAGGDIVSQTVTTTDTQDYEYRQGKKKIAVQTSDETLHGTQINAGNNIVLQAGNDITLTAAALNSEAGAIGLSAERDVNLLAGQEQHDFEQDTSKKKSGFLNSTTTKTHDESHDSLAVGTTLSGQTVAIAAGRGIL